MSGSALQSVHIHVRMIPRREIEGENHNNIINRVMETKTKKKSIHKGFALIWLGLTTAGLFTVTQEALGVTCPWSLG